MQALFSGHGGPGHEFADLVRGVIVGKAGERPGQPCVRVEGVELAVLDERGDHGPVVAALVGAGEQGVLAIEGEGPNRPFDGVVVEVDAAIVEEPGEAIPAGERIADRLAELALGADLAVTGFKVLTQILDDDAATLGSSGTALLD